VFRGSGQRGDDLVVIELPKLLVPGADAEIRLRRLERDYPVGDGFEPLRGIARGRWHGNDDALRPERSNRERGCVHRRARGHSIIDDHDRAPSHVGRAGVPTVGSLAALELEQLAPPDGFDILAQQIEAREDIVVVDRNAARSDRPDCQLRVGRRTDFSDDENIDRRLKSRGNLACDRHTPARQAEHEYVVANTEFAESRTQSASRSDSIRKDLHDTHASAGIEEHTTADNAYRTIDAARRPMAIGDTAGYAAPSLNARPNAVKEPT
jgi:hypothetical protein